MGPRDSRNILAFLVHSGRNNIILEREQFELSGMLQCHSSYSFGKLPLFSFLQ